MQRCSPLKEVVSLMMAFILMAVPGSVVLPQDLRYEKKLLEGRLHRNSNHKFGRGSGVLSSTESYYPFLSSALSSAAEPGSEANGKSSKWKLL